MASTYGQAKAGVKSAVRRVRQIYRTADTSGEKVERELDRLIKRKTLITVQTLLALQAKVEDFQSKASNIDKPLQDAMAIAGNIFA
jgi:hypothetical protein